MRIVFFRNYKEDLQLSMKAYADCVINELRKKKIDWEIIEFYPKNILFELSLKKKSISKVIDLVNRYLYYPMQIKGIEADIYHIIDHSNALLIKSLNNDRIVITCHDIIPYLMSRNYFKGIKKPPLALKIFEISMKYLLKAKLIFADSENTRNDLIKFLGIDKKKIEVIYLGSFYPYKRISEDKRNNYRESLGLNENIFVILQVGNNLFYKNNERVLQVLSELPDKINDKKWLFLHIGSYYNDKFIKMCLGGKYIDRIKNLGMLNYEELEKYYNIADVLFFPSLYEGFGMPVLEAMQCGLPVITSNVSSLREVGGGAVEYVDPYNIENMREVLCNVLRDKDLRDKMKIKGLERARLFNWNMTITKMISCYEKIIN